MRKGIAIVIVCCAFALAMGLVGCGGSSSGSAASSASSDASSASSSEASSSASSAAQAFDAPAECIAVDGGLTFAAACELTGPEFTALLNQQDYYWDSSWHHWTSKSTKDYIAVQSMSYENGERNIKKSAYEAAAGKGELAQGYVEIMSYAYDSPESGFEDLTKGLTVQEQKTVKGGDEVSGIVTDSAGTRHLVRVGYNADRKYVSAVMETDEYLKGIGTSGLDGMWEILD